MTRLHGVTSVPMPNVPTAQVYGNQGLHSDIGVFHAGRARWLAEYVTGERTPDNEPCAPSPPHAPPGTPGHDHSGGVFGAGIQHCIFCAVFGMDDTAASTNIRNGRAPRMQADTAMVATSKRYVYAGPLRGFWVPACSAGGVYSDAELRMEIYASGSFSMRARYELGGYSQTESLSLSSGTNNLYFANNVPLEPGKFQRCRFELYFDGTYGSTYTASLLSLSFHQTRTTP